MKRAGFTMIELIFVIVILGILAAVAIPKLAATRDDANIAKRATEAATAVSDFGAYYTAQGSFAATTEGGAGQMSNVFSGDTSDMNTTGTTITLPDAPCITYVTLESTGTAGLAADSINVLYDASAADTICMGAASAARSLFGQNDSWVPDTTTDKNLTHTFGGSSVKW